MAIIRINPDNIERYTLVANPRRTFSSASDNVSSVVTPGITGTLPLFADNTTSFKKFDAAIQLPNNFGGFNDSNIDALRQGFQNSVENGTSTYGLGNLYLQKINELSSAPEYSKNQSVFKFVPGYDACDAGYLRKAITVSSLFPFYRIYYQSLHYNYTNYHSLNFTTSSLLPGANSALIYPAGTGTVDLAGSNPYAPDTGFTFDFYINPRYTQENIGDEFTAGTILHMSSCYAVSLVTGSSEGIDGKKDGYRLLLQLSQSAEIPPSSIAISGDTVTAPGATADPGFLFVSPDNSLSKNTWHHVAVRWGGTSVQNGTGSFVIDGSERSAFVITSASVMAPIQTATGQHDSDALFIGNFYEGSNFNTDAIAGFFNSTDAAIYGTVTIPSPSNAVPTDYSMNHPLNAEIHDLKIFNTYRSDQQILTSSQQGFFIDANVKRTGVSGSQPYLSGTDAGSGLLFYTPPFFTKESPTRRTNASPFITKNSQTTTTPFNTDMSFGVAGHELNLQNFTREFVRAFYPRPLGFEANQTSLAASLGTTANEYIYAESSNRKRNALVIPCDNGKFRPAFETLNTGSFLTTNTSDPLSLFVNDYGGRDFSKISLDNLTSLAGYDTKSADTKMADCDYSNSVNADLYGPTPEDPSITPIGSRLAVLDRTRDSSSNEVTLFDISNMFYGDQIKPQSVVIKDLAVTGTAGRVQVTLKDDGYGNLYRADSVSPHAMWSSVGNVIYEEGIIIVKSPNLPLFGSDAWEISFEGERNIHVLEVNVLADKGLINSSSNPTYQKLIPTDNHNETAKEFVYLTGLQLHDDNLNVIARANFAQPMVKRDGDRYTVRLRMDF
jgi:hypothetical protein